MTAVVLNNYDMSAKKHFTKTILLFIIFYRIIKCLFSSLKTRVLFFSTTYFSTIHYFYYFLLYFVPFCLLIHANKRKGVIR